MPASRAAAAEDEAIALVLDLAERHGCARPRRAPLVVGRARRAARRAAARRARDRRDLPALPHVRRGGHRRRRDTEFKCAPPIREKENRELLWDGPRATARSTWSSPTIRRARRSSRCPSAGDFAAAWGGIASLQLSLAALWTGARGRGFALTDVARWMCALRAPRGLAEKGAEPGRDADLVVWYPDAEFSVTPALLRHRHKVTPDAGRSLFGRVATTFLRGEPVFDRGAFPGPPAGRRLGPGPR